MSATRHIAAFALAAIVLQATPAAAEERLAPITAGQMHREFCSSEEVGFRAVCKGYAWGVADASAKAGEACTRPKVSAFQMTEIAIRHIRDNPATWDQPAAEVMREAYRQAFPCPQPGG